MTIRQPGWQGRSKAMMTTDTPWHESFMVRLWAEPDGEQLVLRGSAHNVQTGRTVYFNTLDLPVGLIREAAERLSGAQERMLS